MARLYTIGYERLLPAELVNELTVAGVARLIDARYRPQLYRAGRSEEARAAFLEHVERTAAGDLDVLASELDRAPATALMCLEADPGVCHRRVLAEALTRRRPDLEVVDL